MSHSDFEDCTKMLVMKYKINYVDKVVFTFIGSKVSPLIFTPGNSHPSWEVVASGNSYSLKLHSF